MIAAATHTVVPTPGGPAHGSVYPQPRRPASPPPRLLPPRGLRHFPPPGRRLGRLPGPPHHLAPLGDHRPRRRRGSLPCLPPVQPGRLELGRGLPPAVGSAPRG